MEQRTETKETKEKEAFFNAGSAAANERVALLAALREEMLLLGSLLKEPPLQFPDSWEKKIRLRLAAIEKLKSQIDALSGDVTDATRSITATSPEADRFLKEIEEIHQENIRLAEQARAAFANALSTLHLFKKSKAYLPATPFSAGAIINRQG